EWPTAPFTPRTELPSGGRLTTTRSLPLVGQSFTPLGGQPGLNWPGPSTETQKKEQPWLSSSFSSDSSPSSPSGGPWMTGTSGEPQTEDHRPHRGRGRHHRGHGCSIRGRRREPAPAGAPGGPDRGLPHHPGLL